MDTRGYRILQALKKEKELVQYLNVPKYESTKGTTKRERDKIIKEDVVFGGSPSQFKEYTVMALAPLVSGDVTFGGSSSQFKEYTVMAPAPLVAGDVTFGGSSSQFKEYTVMAPAPLVAEDVAFGGSPSQFKEYTVMAPAPLVSEDVTFGGSPSQFKEYTVMALAPLVSGDVTFGGSSSQFKEYTVMALAPLVSEDVTFGGSPSQFKEYTVMAPAPLVAEDVTFGGSPSQFKEYTVMALAPLVSEDVAFGGSPSQFKEYTVMALAPLVAEDVTFGGSPSQFKEYTVMALAPLVSGDVTFGGSSSQFKEYTVMALAPLVSEDVTFGGSPSQFKEYTVMAPAPLVAEDVTFGGSPSQFKEYTVMAPAPLVAEDVTFGGSPSQFKEYTVMALAPLVAEDDAFGGSPSQFKEYRNESNTEAITPQIQLYLEPLNSESAKKSQKHTDDECSSIQPLKKRKKRCDRRNCCFYCNCVLTNLTRHMVRQHPNETDVARYIALMETSPQNSKNERQKIMESIRIKGNYVHNTSMINQSEVVDKMLLPIKRPPALKEKSSSSYVTCKMCHGLFVRKHFFRHAQFCQEKLGVSNTPQNSQSNEFQHYRKKSLPSYIKDFSINTCCSPKDVCNTMSEKIIPRLCRDEIGQTAINDKLILYTCNDFLKSHLNQKDQNQVARKMRDGSKLLISCKKRDSTITQLSDCFNPCKVNTVIESVRELCGCTEDGNVAVVGMPARLAWIINECGKRVIDDTLSSSTINKETKQERKGFVTDFLQLIRRRWQYEVSSNAENSRKRKKMTKERIMPDSDDVKCFSRTVSELAIKYYKKLLKNVTPGDYEMLCKLLIAQIIALNARRPLEASKIPIEFFLKREKNSIANEELLSMLTPDEIKTYHLLSEFHVPGKLEQMCSILLTKDMEDGIQLIVTCREILKIPASNKFLFARPGLETPFDGSAVIRELRGFCSLNKPDHLTCTGLRHFCATMALLKGKDFTTHMSKFMSHTLQVHNKNYCFPVDIINRGKIGHFLLGLQDLPTMSKNDARSSTSQISEVSATKVIDTNTFQELSNNVSEEIDDPSWQPTVVEEPLQKKSMTRKPWSEEDKETIIEKFMEYIQCGKNPGPSKCSEFLSGNIQFQGRTGLQLNSLIDNLNKGKTKMPSKYARLKVVNG